MCLECGANDLHIVVQLMPLPPLIFCFIKIQTKNGLTFLVPAYPVGFPAKEAVKRVSVLLLLKSLLFCRSKLRNEFD